MRDAVETKQPTFPAPSKHVNIKHRTSNSAVCFIWTRNLDLHSIKENIYLGRVGTNTEENV
jgi:hypothetical protein